LPSSSSDAHLSRYAGGQLTLAYIRGRHNARAGIYGFGQTDHQTFGLKVNKRSDPNFGLNLLDTENTAGALAALFAEEQFSLAQWLTLNAGVRVTRFSGGVAETATSPRFGAALHAPKIHWVFRAFYGHFYQSPPLVTLSGPSLQQIIKQQNFTFVPLRGERDEESQFGVSIPLKAWMLDADTFRTRARNYFDHNNLNNSDLFFPLTIDGALIRGWELTLLSPRIKERVQVYVTYSNQIAQGRGAINGGLIPAGTVSGGDFFTLDHDQRNTLHVGGNVALPWRSYASTDVYYASGFSNGMPPPDHLLGHTTFDVSLGKAISDRFSLSVTAINVANRPVLLDNSFTFGGTHFLNPREVVAQVRYRFHY
jgi:outer membrane receptor protein involved in Fe transport